MAEKVYLNGGGKEVVFRDGGSLLNIYIDVNEAREKGFIKKSKNGTEYLSFTVAKRREETMFGDTHLLYGTVFESGGGKAKASKATASSAKSQSSKGQDQEDDGSDELPF